MLTARRSFLEQRRPGAGWPSLNELLREHDCACASQPMAVDAAFGDGHLLGRDPTCRRVRRLAADCGYEPTARPVGNHRAFALGALPSILRDRALPVVPNTAALREVAERLGDRLSAFHVARLGVEGNRILHEASHGVAHEVLLGGPDPMSLFVDRDWRDAMVELQLCEAFAGAVEAMVGAQVLGSGPSSSDLLFLKFNSYFYVEPDEVQAFGALIDGFGRRRTFAGLWLAHLCSHFLSKKTVAVDRSQLLAVLERMRPRDDRLAEFVDAMAPLMTSASKMNVFFRVDISDFYLQFAGSPVPLEEAVGFDFLPHLAALGELVTRAAGLIDRVFDRD